MANILFVDDDKIARNQGVCFLTSAGHSVETACDGVEGLEKFARESFDVVVTDIIMPEKDGIQMIIEMRQQDSAIPIIAISSECREGKLDILEIARKFGATRLLCKPFEANELIAHVQECLVTTARKT